MHPIEEVIGYSFKNKSLVIRALTHRSFVNETEEDLSDNEKMELLGDSVLALVSLEYLLSKYRNLSEGKIVKIKSILVSETMLSKAAADFNLGNFIYLSKGEEQNNGRNRSSILADAFEALVGAIYIDAGLEEARKFLHKFLMPKADDFSQYESMIDYKTILQEHSQSVYKVVPKYSLLESYGPDHKKVFVIGVYSNNKLIAKAKGFSKKEAEQLAAKRAAEIWGVKVVNIFG